MENKRELSINSTSSINMYLTENKKKHQNNRDDLEIVDNNEILDYDEYESVTQSSFWKDRQIDFRILSDLFKFLDTKCGQGEIN